MPARSLCHRSRAKTFTFLAAVTLLLEFHSCGNLLAQEAQSGGGMGKLIVPAAHMPKCVTMVTPNYPQGDAADRVAGTVKLRVIIRTSGSVTPLHLVVGKPQFEQSAMNAVRLWRYKPYFLNGHPVEITTDVNVDFNPSVQGGVITHPEN